MSEVTVTQAKAPVQIAMSEEDARFLMTVVGNFNATTVFNHTAFTASEEFCNAWLDNLYMALSDHFYGG